MIVLAGVLFGVTLGGHLLSRKSVSARGFFTGEGQLPWWTVSASMYATVVSAVSFISIPAGVFGTGGNLTLIQLLIGFALGKLLMALLFCRPYYESKSIETVYDYLTARINGRIATTTMGLQILLLLAGNSVVVLSAALVLNVLTDVSLPLCCIMIVGFAVLWSWMGGLSTVVWTDAMLFGVFLAGAVVSAVITFFSTGTDIAESLQILDAQAKLQIMDLSLDPKRSFTLWTGIFCGTLIAMVPISSQAGLQRIRACRSAAEARKAIVFSILFLITPVFLLIVGLGLALFYADGMPPELAARLATQPDQVFPFFMLNEIPDGLSGLFVAAVLAAAVSTLDSRLTELADVTVTNVYRPYLKPVASEGHYLRVARVLIVGWGLFFCVTSVSLSMIDGQSMFDLSLMAGNTFGGPILGVFLLARFNLGSTWGVVLGTVLSVGISLAFSNAGVTHYWWFPVSVALMLLIGVLTRAQHFDADGVVPGPLSK